MTGFLYDGQTQAVQQAALAALASVAANIKSLLTAPGSAALALAQDLPLLEVVAADNQAGYAAALAQLLADYVAAIVGDASTPASPAAPAGYEYSSRLPPLPADPSFGLAALAAAGADPPAPPSGQILANTSALNQLVGGSAVAALATLYAQTAFTSAAQAETARTQLFGLIVDQIEAAAGNDALVMTWRGLLTAAVTDLTARASGLPDVAILPTPVPLPALVLAELLYQDGTAAAALVQRNAAPHPLFLPLSVEYLEAA